jgi:SAM-dependent methyltransferase
VSAPTCRFCSTQLRHTVVDLGTSPLCESYVSVDRYNDAEPFYPLHVYVCESCYLVQLKQLVPPDAIFSEYAYFASYADSWVRAAKRYTDMIIARLGLDAQSLVVEVGSNDGYLLQHFVAVGIPTLGIDPAANVATAARKKHVFTLVEFFGEATARRVAADGRRADLLVANNVLAQVPDLHDFLTGIEVLLAPRGIATLEFPHLMRLMGENQFDTIYHEHFSYFSLLVAERILADHGLRCFDVEELPTHGGSLRLYVCHAKDATKPTLDTVPALLDRERTAGFDRVAGYAGFAEQVKETKRAILAFLIEAKRCGRTVAGYGAPGKGNTLLNYCGVRTDFIDYTVDRNPYKQGKYLPGSRIPIYHPDRIAETKPDYVFILPWNVKDEIMEQMHGIREWGGQFVVPIPVLRVIP